MNWNAIGAVGEIVGALAVVATLFYLAIQMRSATAQARRAELNETMRQASVVRMALARNPQLAAVVLKGAEHYESLSAIEKLQFDSIVQERFWAVVQIWDRSRSGHIDSDGWTRMRKSPPPLLISPGYLKCWDAHKFQYPAAFVEEIEQIRQAAK